MKSLITTDGRHDHMVDAIMDLLESQLMVLLSFVVRKKQELRK